jgi:hypothetical protein
MSPIVQARVVVPFVTRLTRRQRDKGTVPNVTLWWAVIAWAEVPDLGDLRARRAVTGSRTTQPEVVLMSLVFQVLGSLAVLAGFAASQFGWLTPQSVVYLVVNAVGSGVLAADAIYEAQWGFLLLEGAWAIVSVAGLVKVAIAANQSGAGAGHGKETVHA